MDIFSAIQTVANGGDGKIAFKYILSTICQVDQANGYTDTIQMARQEGRRSVALDLKTILGDDLYYAILQTKV